MQNNTYKHIWKMADLLRSNIPANGSFEVILSLLMIKSMDDQLKPFYKELANMKEESGWVSPEAFMHATNYLPFYNHSGISLEDILYCCNDTNVVFTNYLNSFDEETNSILNALELPRYITFINSGKILGELIRICLDIDTNLEEIRTYIACAIDNLIERKGIERTEFSSPFELGYYISHFLFKNVKIGTQASFFDPVCGTSRMLSQVVDIAIGDGYVENAKAYGSDISFKSYGVSCALARILRNDYMTFSTGNYLLTSTEKGIYDFIVADPPMGLRLMEDTYNDINLSNALPVGIAKNNSSDLLFMAMLLKNLKSEGRMAIVTSERPMFSQQGSDEQLRAYLFDNGYVESIIKLPTFIDSATNIPRYLWIMKRNANSSHSVMFVDLYSYAKDYPTNDCKELLCNYESLTETTEKYAHVVSVEELRQYRVFLKNKKTGKSASVQIPCTEKVVTSAISRMGYDVNHGVWEILYEKTVLTYNFTFASFFSEEDKYVAAKDVYTKVKPSLADLSTDLEKLLSLEIPEYREPTNCFSSWAGAVPMEWNGVNLSAFTEIISSAKPKESVKGDVTVLSLDIIRGNAKKTIKTNKEECTLVYPSDVLVVKSGANTGEVFTDQEGALGSTLMLIRLIDDRSNGILRQYFPYMMLALENSFRKAANGVAQLSLKKAQLENIVCFIPSLEEQTLIVDFLRNVCHSVNNIQKVLGTKIPKLEELKKKIIFDAVTGKFKF